MLVAHFNFWQHEVFFSKEGDMKDEEGNGVEVLQRLQKKRKFLSLDPRKLLCTRFSFCGSQ